MFTLPIFLAVLLLTVAAILFYPSLRVGKKSVDTFWVPPTAGALLLLLLGECDGKTALSAITADTAINPLKILVLFISMTIMSIFLDEIGFFAYLAGVTLRRAKASQWKLFLYLYLTVSVLTVFTSNDVIILSFTPFICYFAKNAHIDPMPYLASEFVAANTWSMALIIGNPTNIYLATASGIDFSAYVSRMILPTLAAGTVAFFLLWLTFRKSLAAPMHAEPVEIALRDKPSLVIGVAHLAVCTVLLAIGSYVGLPMWIVALGGVVSLFLWAIVFSLIRHRTPRTVTRSLARAPWQLIPFVLSMFILIITLEARGYVQSLSSLLAGGSAIFRYGVASFLAANLINNIPMSVLFSSVITASGTESLAPVYAAIVGSNIGAFLTPIGALAGIMWSSILRTHGLKFGYRDFLKIGVTVAIPVLLAALAVLALLF